jgi:hypothetical protein
MKRHLLLAVLVTAMSHAQGQVLISLLLGDNLNTGKIEFGLDGGANFTTLDGVSGASAATGFHLGFYFDIKLKEAWYLHTGVIVKSPMGARELAPYALGVADLDSVFAGGDLQRKLHYFNVPVMMKHAFPNHLYAEGGIMLGLLHSAKDVFTNEVNTPEDLTYTLDIVDQYYRLDAGLAAGIGYHLMKGNGMYFGVRGYYGLVDITKDDTGPGVYNRAVYLAVGIPIGKGKAAAKAAAAEE